MRDSTAPSPTEDKIILNFKNAAAIPGGGVTCICRDMGMCHYFGYHFLAMPGFLGVIFFGKI